MLPEILKAVTSTGLIKEIYGDLAKPGVQQVGKALETTLALGNTLLIPLSLANAKGKVVLEKNLNSYKEKLKNIPSEEISEVPPEIGVPIIEKLTYTTNEEISDLYINLLAKASLTEKQNQAHPSFVNIIDNLSPDEAEIIKFIKGKSNLPFIDRTFKDKNGSYQVIQPTLTGFEKDMSSLIFPNNIPAYLSNLDGLGILKFRRDIWASDDTLYIELDEKYKMNIVGELPEGKKIDFNKGLIEVTDFGVLFIESCTTLIKI